MNAALRCLVISLLVSTGAAFAAAIPFGPQQIISTSQGFGVDVIARDLDGDGDLDLVGEGGTNAGSGVYSYENLDGKGTFSAAQAIGPGQLENRASTALVDMDLDGDLDLLTGDFTTCAWYPNDGQGNFGARTVVRNGFGFTRFDAGDLDGDGDPDVIGVTGSEINELAWFRNNGGGTFNPATQNFIDSLPNGYGEGRALPADVDADGDLDLVVLQSTGGDRVAWYRNTDGAGTFSAKLTISTIPTELGGIAVADVDRDGDLDVVSAEYGGFTVRWHENTAGDGSAWTNHTISSTDTTSFFVNVADMDLDGDIDVVLASRTLNQAIWIENTAGDGSAWTKRVVPGSVAWPLGTIAADIDGDGDPDLATASLDDNKFAWTENRTIHRNAVFPAESTISTAADAAFSVFAADVDGDGDVDVLSASQNDDKVAWYENNGASPPVWTARTISTAADGAQSVVAQDLDGDGDVDVLSASVFDDKIAWYENNGGTPPAWTARTISTNANGAFAVFAADADGDGDVDALSASVLDDKIAWYENRGGQYGFSGTDISTGSAYDGEVAPMLAVGLQVHGRPGDSVGRLATLALRLESPTGILDAPLSSAQANALFDELRIYRDNGSGQFEESQDILVTTVGTLSLTAGVQSVTLPASDPNVRVAAPATFFVTGLMSPTASQQLVNAFYVTHLAATSVVVDGNAGLTLSGAGLDNVASLTIQARPRFVVNSTADGVDASPGNLICATSGGACTLRAAIQEANAHFGADRIVLPAGTFTLTLGGSGEDSATTGDLDVTDISGRLTLVGQGAAGTIISANGIDRVLHLLSSAALTLEDVTITGGAVHGPGARGAGLLTETSNQLTIRRCAFRGNASFGSGGAALATGGSNLVTVENSVFHGNTGFDGGSTIHSGSAMNVISCTISGNTGILASSVAVETLGALNVDNSTITANNGGLRASSSSITLSSSIVAGNPSAGLTGDDVNTGTFTSAGYNFIGESASGAFVNGVNGDQVGTIGFPIDPVLKPLGDYGGPTLTHPPLSASPVVDKGRCLSVTADQRGVHRPIDVAGVANASDGCDVGAYELESGATLARVEVPIRWCGLHGAPSVENPSLMGASNVNDLLRRRHEAATDNIYAPQSGIVFRSAANFIVENYPLLEDPDCVLVSPGNYSCTRGVRGDVYIDPDVANFDEYEELIAACRAAWHVQDPTLEGITAVQIRQFVGDTGTPLAILGIGGRAREGDVREQAEAGRVAVVDHFYRQSVPGNPSPPNPSDTIDRLLAHELGHAVSLRHGDGLDNDTNGVIDDADEAAVGLPRFDGNNIMQYRSGSELTVGQSTQARSHIAATVPDVRVQPISDAAPNAVPIDPKNARILDFGFKAVLNLANARILDFKNANILDFEQDGVVDFANARILDFKNANILDFKNARILDFGMSYNGETGAGSTSLHATTAAIPWPPALRPTTRYYFYLDVDRDDATGAYPASKVNPSEAPNRFPGSNNFVSSPTVAEEAGVDLIAQVDLQSSCTGNDCTSTSNVRIFDYNDGTGVYIEVSSTPSPSISALSVGLYVDNGGAPVDLDTAPTGITIQPVIPNSVLFAAGWGFTTPPGGGAPVPNPVRMEVVTTIGCAGNILNDGSAASSRDCQCTSCASCPDYPGCVGTTGIPMTLAGTTILTDDKSGELTFQPPVLPTCTVIPALASQGQAVTVYVTQLPTDVTGTVEVSRAGTILGTTPTASISAAGSVGVAATLPSTALGQVTLSAGITGYAPRAQCLVTVTPTLACTDADADGTCDNVDGDDDNDGVVDASDAASLNRLVCRDVDADQCDDCSGGVSAPALDGPDYDRDGLCDRGDPDDDNDGVLDGVDGQPRNPNACGDIDADHCDDCVIAASPSPGNDGPDVEGDGLCDFGDPDDDNDGVSDWIDCAPLNGALRAVPAPVSGLGFGSGGVKNRLSWTSPQAQGGSATVSDAVRGALSALPVGSGAETCLASGVVASQVDDAVTPTTGTALWYLVRGRNACGTGSYGTQTSGAQRTSTACP